MNRCIICDNDKENTTYVVKELQLGLSDSFKYMECGSCGCLFLIDVPSDMSKYYPTDYYSFIPMTEKSIPFLKRFIQNRVRKQIISYYENQGGGIRLISRIFPAILPPIEYADNVKNKKILDIGCGHGKLLVTMAKAGFARLFGADPYVDSEIVYKLQDGNEIRIFKCDLFGIDEKYDIVMLNHSFEHMFDHEKVLMHIHTILEGAGECVITIPTTSSYAWLNYRENWFNLDAPRHLIIHSIDSLKFIAKKCGFKVKWVTYVSEEGPVRSKLYKKGWDFKRQNRYLYKTPIGIIRLITNKILSTRFNRRLTGDIVRVCLEKGGG